MVTSHRPDDPGIPREPGSTTAEDSGDQSLFASLMDELQAAAMPDSQPEPEVAAPGSRCRPAALESMPHVMQRVTRVWGTREFEPQVMDLLIDSRDGVRKGLPIDLGSELDFLIDLNKTLRAIDASRHLKVSFAEASNLITAGDAAYMEGLAEKPLPADSPSPPPRHPGAAPQTMQRSVAPPAKIGPHHPGAKGKTSGGRGETLLFAVVVVLIVATVAAILWRQ